MGDALLRDETDRSAIRQVLRETAVLPSGSPSAEIRADELVETLVDIVRNRWRGEREARADEVLALRGETVTVKQDLHAERRRRRAVEKTVDRLRVELGEVRSELTHKTFLVKFYEAQHGAPVADQLEQLAAQAGKHERQLWSIGTSLDNTLFLVRLVLATSVVAGGSFAIWLPLEVDAVTGPWRLAYVAALGVVTATAGVWILAGRNVARRLFGWALVGLTVIASSLQILSFLNRD